VTISYDKKLAEFTDAISIEDAEILLEWLKKTPKSRLDLKQCTHLHAAILQVMMAANPIIAAWPQAEHLRAWLQAALNQHKGN
jgi:hypothetical protein